MTDGALRSSLQVRVRFEKLAKAKGAHLVAATDGLGASWGEKGDGSGLDAGQCSTLVAGDRAPVASGAEGGAPASRARVDFSRCARPPLEKSRRTRRPPPPPLGSGLADLLSLLSLCALCALLFTRAYRCEGASWRAWLTSMTSATKLALSHGFGGDGAARRQLGAQRGARPGAETTDGFARVLSEAGDGLSSRLPPAFRSALAEAQRMEVRYEHALLAELDGSCGTRMVWDEQGSGLLHASALLVVALTFVVLLRQSLARVAGKRPGPASSDGAQRPLLPVSSLPSRASGGAVESSSAAEGLPLAPWTSLALAELFLAAYTTRLFVTSGGGDEGAGVWWESGAAKWVLGTITPAHAFVLICAAALVLAATRRALQIWCWHRQVAEALAQPPVPKVQASPKTQPSGQTADKTRERGGRTVGKQGAAHVKAPPKKRLFPARCVWCPPLHRLMDAWQAAEPPMPAKGAANPCRRLGSTQLSRKAMM